MQRLQKRGSVLVGVCDGEIGQRIMVESVGDNERYAHGGSAGPYELLVEKKKGFMVVDIKAGGRE